MKKSCKNIWRERKKCIPLHSLSGSKRASADGRQAGSDAEGCCDAADTRLDTDTDGNSGTKAMQKKSKKNLEVTNFLLTFAKFFRLTKTDGQRTTGSGAGKSPRTLKDLQ